MKKLYMERNKQVNNLRKNSFISKEESKSMKIIDDNQKMPYVFFQPKIGKPFHPETGTFQARAIVETASSPLSALENYLFTVTNPIMDKLPGVVQNSTQLMKRIDNNVSCVVHRI